MVTTRSGNRAFSTGKPRRKRSSNSPKSKTPKQRRRSESTYDMRTIIHNDQQPQETPRVDHPQRTAPHVGSPLYHQNPASPEPTIIAAIVESYSDAMDLIQATVSQENEPESPIPDVVVGVLPPSTPAANAAVDTATEGEINHIQMEQNHESKQADRNTSVSAPEDHKTMLPNYLSPPRAAPDGAKSDNDNGYASDDTCRASNALVTKVNGILHDPVTPRVKDKSWKVRFSLPSDIMDAPAMSHQTPTRHPTKKRRGTPHPTQTRSSGSSGSTGTCNSKSIKDIGGTPKPQQRSSSYSTPQKLTFDAKLFSYMATTTPQNSRPLLATTPRSMPTGVSKHRTNSTGTKIGFTSHTKHVNVQQKSLGRHSSAATPTTIMSTLVPTPPTKSEQRMLLVTNLGKLEVSIANRKKCLLARKLRQCELEQELEKVRSDINVMNTKQQQERGRCALYKSRIATLDELLALESVTAPLSSKNKRKSIGSAMKPIDLVSSSDDGSSSSNNNNSDSDIPIHKKPRTSFGFTFVY